MDNQACLDVIEAMPPRGLGVLAVLDSQCKFPKATDETFMTALGDTLQNNAHFALDTRHQDQFQVVHYAGPVVYACNGFLDKNKDTLNAGKQTAVNWQLCPAVQCWQLGELLRTIGVHIMLESSMMQKLNKY